jgi:protoporphyrinogen oxidase
VLEVIANPVKKKADIKYGHVVVKIQGRTKENDRISVTTKNRTVFHFDEVVFTAPLGVLKRNLHMFEPAVPNRFSEAVDSLGYGHLDKVWPLISA